MLVSIKLLKNLPVLSPRWLKNDHAVSGRKSASYSSQSVSTGGEDSISCWLTQSRIFSSLSIVQKSWLLNHMNHGVSLFNKLHSPQQPTRLWRSFLPPFDWAKTWSNVLGFGRPQYAQSSHLSRILFLNLLRADRFCKQQRLNTRSFSLTGTCAFRCTYYN